jgi:hypothetical protein
MTMMGYVKKYPETYTKKLPLCMVKMRMRKTDHTKCWQEREGNGTFMQCSRECIMARALKILSTM